MKKVQNQIINDMIVIGVAVIIILIALLVEFRFIPYPTWLLNRTGSNAIYQTLVTVQASMIAIVLAIISVIASINDKKLYGMSAREYITDINPLPPFKLRSVFISSLALIALSWICVSLNLNNIAIGLFFVTIIMLGYFVISTLRIVMLSNELENGMKLFIICMLEKEDYRSTEALLNEACDNIKFENSNAFAKNSDFIRGDILNVICKTRNQEHMDLFQNQILDIIHTARIRGSYFIKNVLLLCNEIFEVASKESNCNNTILFDKLSNNWELYRLIQKLPFSNLSEEMYIVRQLLRNLFDHNALDSSREAYSIKKSIRHASAFLFNLEIIQH